MSVIKYIRLPFTFDAGRLKRETEAIERQHWQLHYQVKHYEGNWSAIPLRSVNGQSDNIFVSPETDAAYAPTPFLEQSPYLREVLNSFQCPLLGVRLLRLDAGARIKEHRDTDLAFEKGEVRIHIPVITHPEVNFRLGGEEMRLQEGECWYMNFNLPHSIENNSPVHRIHLVIDAVVNDWVKEIFARPGLLRRDIEEPVPDPDTQRKIIASLREMNTETSIRLADEMEAGLSAF